MSLQVTTNVSEKERHLQDVYSLLYDNGKLYSSAADGIVKVWDDNLRLIKEFQAHPSVVYDLAIIGNSLYTCSNDGTVKSWNKETFEPRATLLESEDEVSKFYVDQGKLYGGDDKGMIRLWEDDNMRLVWSLVEEVKGLVVIGNLIFSVRDRDVVITETGEKGRYSIRKTMEGSSPMCKAGNKICFVSRSETEIHIIDSSKETSFKELGVLKGHNMIINCLRNAGDSVLYSGSYDKTVKKWDLDTFSCAASCDTGECVNALAIGKDGQVYAGGSNGFLCRLN